MTILLLFQHLPLDLEENELLKSDCLMINLYPRKKLQKII